MRVAGRVASWMAVSVLVLVTAAAAGLSAWSTAGELRFGVPPTGSAAAAGRLVAAAGRDIAAGSFVADQITTRRRPPPAARQHLELVYQAPDRSALIGPASGPGGSPVEGSLLITVGGILYSQSRFTSAGPQWVATPIPRGRPRGGSVATGDLTLLQHLAGVVEHGDTYRAVVVGEIPRGSPQARADGAGESELVATATVTDGRVTTESLVFRSQQKTEEVTERYGRFGTAPAISPPAHAQAMHWCGTVPVLGGAPCPRAPHSVG